MSDVSNDLFIDLPKQRTHILDWGGPSDAPTIILLHGLNLTSNAKVWNFVAPNLKEKFRVVAMDQRSHGLTGVPTDGDYNDAALCEDIYLICDQLNITQPIVVGHSWGCNVALEYAARYSGDVKGIVMIDGGFVGLKKVMAWPDFEKIQTPLVAGDSLSKLQDQAKYWLGDDYSAEILELILGGFEVSDDKKITPHLNSTDFFKISRAQWEIDADKLYSDVSCPALFLPSIQPEPHDQLHQQMLSWKKMTAPLIQSLMPQAEIDWLIDSIHDVHLQRPELVAEKICAFVETIDL